mmetsp:Transcript_1117/g.1567  ORF Transcript_1117/g.1567 Transcript_1117/m.1567 type:complete len:379 (-) Transcript_1117:88-1224(-)
MDVVFAVDSSGSMSGKIAKAKEAVKTFIDKIDALSDSSEAGLVSWHHGIEFSESLTNNFSYLKGKVIGIGASGGTDLNQGLRGAISVLDANSRTGSSSQVIIFLTDGVGKYDLCKTPGSESGEAADKGYDIYSIRLGAAPVKTALEDMATCTSNGKYFDSPSQKNLDTVFNDIFKTVIESTIPHNIGFEIEYANGITPTGETQSSIDGGTGLSDGQERDFSFTASSKSANDVPVLNLANSKMTYTDAKNANLVEILLKDQVHVPPRCNQAPVAICQPVALRLLPGAAEVCTNPDDVNDGSYDPDGDPISLKIDKACFSDPGEYNVTLTVTDDHQAQAVDVAPVTVECGSSKSKSGKKSGKCGKKSKSKSKSKGKKLRH